MHWYLALLTSLCRCLAFSCVSATSMHACLWIIIITSHIHVIMYQTGDKVVKAKESFEAYCKSHGVDIKHDHAKNGIFQSELCINHCKYMHQGLTFSGVNAHNRNGWSKHRIRSLKGLSWCQMIHAHYQWPNAVTSNLWNYAVFHAAAIINETFCRCFDYKSTPIQEFIKYKVYYKPFNCQLLFPMYVLVLPLASGQPFDKWKYNIPPGIYLGVSSIHASTVVLVLSPTTGRVSP